MTLFAEKEFEINLSCAQFKFERPHKKGALPIFLVITWIAFVQKSWNHSITNGTFFLAQLKQTNKHMIKNSTWHFRHILGPSFTQQNNFDYLNRFMKFCIPSRILLWTPVPQEHLTVLIIYPKFGQGDKSWFVPRCKSNSCRHHWIWSHIGLSIEIRKVTSVWGPARPAAKNPPQNFWSCQPVECGNCTQRDGGER